MTIIRIKYAYKSVQLSVQKSVKKRVFDHFLTHFSHFLDHFLTHFMYILIERNHNIGLKRGPGIAPKMDYFAIFWTTRPAGKVSVWAVFWINSTKKSEISKTQKRRISPRFLVQKMDQKVVKFHEKSDSSFTF